MADMLLVMGAFIALPTAHAIPAPWWSERGLVWARRALGLGAAMMCAGLFMKGMGNG